VDIDGPTARERIQLLVALPLAVALALCLILTRPEEVVPPVSGGHPGTFAAPWLQTPPIEVTRSPESDGAQEVRVTVVVNQQVDGAWKNLRKVATNGTIEDGASSTSVPASGLEDLPTSGIFEVGAVVEWFSGTTRLGWTSVGLADPSGVVG
jgi:hypothetical protein